MFGTYKYELIDNNVMANKTPSWFDSLSLKEKKIMNDKIKPIIPVKYILPNSCSLLMIWKWWVAIINEFPANNQ